MQAACLEDTTVPPLQSFRDLKDTLPEWLLQAASVRAGDRDCVSEQDRCCYISYSPCLVENNCCCFFMTPRQHQWCEGVAEPAAQPASGAICSTAGSVSGLMQW